MLLYKSLHTALCFCSRLKPQTSLTNYFSSRQDDVRLWSARSIQRSVGWTFNKVPVCTHAKSLHCRFCAGLRRRTILLFTDLPWWRLQLAWSNGSSCEKGIMGKKTPSILPGPSTRPPAHQPKPISPPLIYFALSLVMFKVRGNHWFRTKSLKAQLSAYYSYGL